MDTWTHQTIMNTLNMTAQVIFYCGWKLTEEKNIARTWKCGLFMLFKCMLSHRMSFQIFLCFQRCIAELAREHNSFMFTPNVKSQPTFWCNRILTFFTRENYSIIILHICHIIYTTTIWGLKILHLKVRKCATKVASRQNSVD